MATLTVPHAVVTGPPRTPLPFGLGSVVSWRAGDRFEGGIQWEALTCDPAFGRGGPGCDPDVTPVGLPKPLDEFPGPEFGTADVFGIYGASLCNPIGSGGIEEGQARAEQHLITREEARVEQALWTGDLGNTPNFSGANGYPAPISSGVHDTAEDALAAVLQGIVTEYGSLGVVHMSWRTAGLLAHRIEVRGGRMYTRATGMPVVVGAGYPDEPLIVGSPALAGWRSDVLATSSRSGDLLDRASNDLYGIAERLYSIAFDPCPLVAAGYTGEVTP